MPLIADCLVADTGFGVALNVSLRGMEGGEFKTVMELVRMIKLVGLLIVFFRQHNTLECCPGLLSMG